MVGISFQPQTKARTIPGIKRGIVNWVITPWKINMEPENDGLEDDFPFQLGGF